MFQNVFSFPSLNLVKFHLNSHAPPPSHQLSLRSINIDYRFIYWLHLSWSISIPPPPSFLDEMYPSIKFHRYSFIIPAPGCRKRACSTSRNTKTRNTSTRNTRTWNSGTGNTATSWNIPELQKNRNTTQNPEHPRGNLEHSPRKPGKPLRKPVFN